MNNVHFRTRTKSIRHTKALRISYIYFFMHTHTTPFSIVVYSWAEKPLRWSSRRARFIFYWEHLSRAKGTSYPPSHPSPIAGVFYIHLKKENHIISPLGPVLNSWRPRTCGGQLREWKPWEYRGRHHSLRQKKITKDIVIIIDWNK